MLLASGILLIAVWMVFEWHYGWGRGRVAPRAFDLRQKYCDRALLFLIPLRLAMTATAVVGLILVVKYFGK